MPSHRARQPTLGESLVDALIGFVWGFSAATIGWLITLRVMAGV